MRELMNQKYTVQKVKSRQLVPAGGSWQDVRTFSHILDW